jgi:hypothetical protein
VLGFYSLKDSQETYSLLSTLKKQSLQSNPLVHIGYVKPSAVVNQLGITLVPSLAWILGNQGWIQVSFASSSQSRNDNHHQVNNWSCQHVLVNLSFFSPISDSRAD